MRARSSEASLGGHNPSRAGNPLSHAIQCLLIATISGGLLWLVWIYGSGLRDPRYLDGWVLAGGMALQISFHIAKAVGLSLKSATRWRKIHILVGYLLIAAFVSHSDFSLPDTSFEWVLSTGYVLVALSGIFGTYLAWAQQAKHWIDGAVSYERIPALRADLEREVKAAVDETDPSTTAIPLPGPPHDAWIKDLYATHLRDFFQGPRNFTAHLIGSQRPLKRLIGEIDELPRYLDQQGQAKLATIKNLVIEKDRLDSARVHFALTRGWLLVHVPVTYTLVVLTILHILVVYAFSSGDW